MQACSHPAAQHVRTVYYLLCGACKQVLAVYYCNYARECHAQCTVAPLCLQEARARYHAQVPLRVERALRPATP